MPQMSSPRSRRKATVWQSTSPGRPKPPDRREGTNGPQPRGPKAYRLEVPHELLFEAENHLVQQRNSLIAIGRGAAPRVLRIVSSSGRASSVVLRTLRIRQGRNGPQDALPRLTDQEPTKARARSVSAAGAGGGFRRRQKWPAAILGHIFGVVNHAVKFTTSRGRTRWARSARKPKSAKV